MCCVLLKCVAVYCSVLWWVFSGNVWYVADSFTMDLFGYLWRPLLFYFGEGLMCIWTSILNLQNFQFFFATVYSKQQDAPWLSLKSPPSCHRSFSFSCPSVWPCWVEMYIHLLPTDPHLPPLASAWSDWRSPCNFKKSGRWFKRKKNDANSSLCFVPCLLLPAPISFPLLSSENCNLEPSVPLSHTHPAPLVSFSFPWWHFNSLCLVVTETIPKIEISRCDSNTLFRVAKTHLSIALRFFNFHIYIPPPLSYRGRRE